MKPDNMKSITGLLFTVFSLFNPGLSLESGGQGSADSATFVSIRIDLNLPRQGVSLLVLNW